MRGDRAVQSEVLGCIATDIAGARQRMNAPGIDSASIALAQLQRKAKLVPREWGQHFYPVLNEEVLHCRSIVMRANAAHASLENRFSVHGAPKTRLAVPRCWREPSLAEAFCCVAGGCIHFQQDEGLWRPALHDKRSATRFGPWAGAWSF